MIEPKRAAYHHVSPAPVPPAATDELLAFLGLPGHLIRRSKQKTTMVFMTFLEAFGITPIQYAVLRVLKLCPSIDRAELREIVGLDNSTTGGVVARLQKRGLLVRYNEARRDRATLTPAGQDLLEKVEPLLLQAQEVILHPLTAREQRQLLRLLSKLVGVSTIHYRVPGSRPRLRRPKPASPLSRPNRNGGQTKRSPFTSTVM